MLIVSDTTPIISLLKANRLEFLEKVYGRVLIPDAVYSELTDNPVFSKEAEIIEQTAFIQRESVSDRAAVETFMDQNGLDAGESEAILLVKEKNADLLLIDERRGRRVAKDMGITIVGTVGILLNGYDKGILSADDIRATILDFQNSRIRIDQSLIEMLERYIQG